MSAPRSPRKSAAIVLTRGRGEQAEVFLALRSPQLRFFGGFYAFPGGVIDPHDVDEEGGGPGAFVRCAVRELFEETGVWLAGPPPEGIDRARLRRGLIASDPEELRSAAREWRAAIGDRRAPLETVLEITTPPFSPQRYETEFFHALLPDGEHPEVWAGELVAGEFTRPEVALDRWRRGEILIAPPVLLVLELLATHGVGGFGAAARAEGEALRSGKLHPVRFGPGIFVAPLAAKTKPPATTTNCFLVGERQIYIVDPAPTEASEQSRLFEKIDRVRDEGATIAGVLLTHSHPDHVGAARATAERYGVAVGAHPDALRGLDLGAVETFPIAHGDEFDLGSAPDRSEGWTLRAIHTPGHAGDHLAFAESRYRSYLVGDLLSAVSTVLIDPPEGHLRTYLDTLERLLEESIGMVYPSHGPAVRTGPAMIRHFIRHRVDRIEQIERVVASGLGSEDDVIAQVYADVPPAVIPLARRSLAASLEYLTEEDRIRRRADGTWCSVQKGEHRTQRDDD